MSDKTVNAKSATIIAGICAFAVAAWAFYAWKSEPRPAPAAPSGESAGGTADGDRPSLAAAPDAAASAQAGIVDEVEGVVPIDAALSVNEPMRAVSGESALMMRTGPADRRVNPPDQPGEDTGRSLEAELEHGRAALSRGDWVAARASLSRALNAALPTGEQETIRRELARINEALVFSRATTAGDPLTQTHDVKPGDRLNLLAREHKVPQELLQRVNGIENPQLLQAGRPIKLVKGPFDAIICKSAHRMDIYHGRLYIRSFNVGLGADNGTPLGRWVVGNKNIDPDWKDPATGRYYAPGDPENPIGERWISLECVEGDCLGRTGFGIHGTLDPKSIGENQSMGCVRLLPDDVSLVFDLLVPRESFVEIRP